MYLIVYIDKVKGAAPKTTQGGQRENFQMVYRYN